jgi:hypothetical protein
MPTVKDVIPHSPFTDHFIRVHREPSQVAVAKKLLKALRRVACLRANPKSRSTAG